MSKMKVKDLAAELGIGNKEILHILRDLDIPVRSHMSSLEEESAEEVRKAVSQGKAATEVVRHEVQPGVVVRRRRRPARKGAKDKASEEESQDEAPDQSAEVVSEQDDTPEVVVPAEKEQTAVMAEAPEKADDVQKDLKAADEPKDDAVSSKKETEVQSKEEKPAPARKKAKSASSKAQATPTPTARIIKPANEVPAEEVPSVEPKEEKQPEAEAPEAVSSPTPDPTSAEAVKEPEVTTAATGDSEKDLEVNTATAQETVETAPKHEKKEEAAVAPKTDKPADSTDSPKQAAAATDADEEKPRKKKKGKKKEKFSGPQVRVISRPEVQPEPAERQPRQRPAPKSDGPSGPSGPSRPAPAGGRGPRPAANRTAPQQDAPSPDKTGANKRRGRKDKRVVEFGPSRDNDRDALNKLRDNKGGKRKKGGRQQAKPTPPAHTAPMKQAKRKVKFEEAVRVSELAHFMGVKTPEVIRILMGLGIMATINQSLDFDTATLVAAEFGYEVEKVGFSEDEFIIPTETDKPEDLKPRPPVVTIMGHVDHGKTSLLDAIRTSDITGGEAGGITQHIGAYHVNTNRGEIVFLDTPGHEAFTAMRARGAEVTDIVVLVVAADDGVMDQTREAVSHSKAAGVPIIVAVNKMDKEDADPERAKRELSELGLMPEDWGGETIFAPVSAKAKTGLDNLLELILLQAEVMELTANPDKPARGHIVEARLDKGRGPVGTVLISEGTLHQGDAFVCGQFSGRVRAMFNDQGKKIKTAGPAIPVEVQGFEGVPEAGDEFVGVTDDKVARRIAEQRQLKQRERHLAKETKVTLESFLQSRPDQEVKHLNLVLKADVQGSLEAIGDALIKLNTDTIKIDIIHMGAGAITESDILLASASDAVIIGFNVRPTMKVKEVAEQEKVEIRFYDIIYKLVGEIKDAMTGMLAPIVSERYLGQAEVRQTFQVSRLGTIAGCAVVDGKILRNARIRLLRNSVVVHTGELSSLKRFKDDAKEVAKGYECGLTIANFNDIKTGDTIEAFEMIETAATLE
ncbi:MAG: translation initiation factor IF-2 [Desulfovibrio sp.]|uniref:translation initiation factor IF-2 n=1 Tax=Desulfovibrio sp. 7SRBS1 TaxID=3378064 RepID=UPI003B40FA19